MVRKVDGAGIISTIAGTGARGFSEDGTPADRAMLNEPWGMEVSPEGDRLRVGHRQQPGAPYRSRMADWRLWPAGLRRETPATGGRRSAAALNAPNGLRLYGSDTLLVSDRFNNKIKAVRLGAE